MGRSAIVAIVGIFLACASTPPGPSLAGVAVEELDGRRGTLELLRGRPALVYLLTTGCDPCLADLPKLRALHARYGERGLRMVAVVLDPTGVRVARPFAESVALPFPVVVASDEMRRGDTSLGVVTAVPRTLVLGPDLRVRADRVGPVAYGELAGMLDAAIDGGR